MYYITNDTKNSTLKNKTKPIYKMKLETQSWVEWYLIILSLNYNCATIIFYCKRFSLKVVI